MKKNVFPILLVFISVCSFKKSNCQDLPVISKFDHFQNEEIIGVKSFVSQREFDRYWNYLYPWGSDHNGSARMYRSNVSLEKGGILRISAVKIPSAEGNSKSKPFSEIHYHSGAIFAKKPIEINDKYPQYVISGYFKLPIVKGTWPAFWLTAVKGWPPEIDILEYKGSKKSFQNTFNYPNKVKTKNVSVDDIDKVWHQYKAIIKKLFYTDVLVEYYIDDKLVDIHKGIDYVGKPMWLIINLQMEGGDGPDIPPYSGSGMPGPDGVTNYYIKDVLVTRKVAEKGIVH